MQIPGFIRGKANKGNKVAAEFIRQYDNGDNTPYDPEAYAAIKAQMGEDGVLDDSFEDDAPRPEDFEQKKVSPAEQKAQERIEELGKQYSGSAKTKEMDFNVSDEMKSWMKNEIDAGYDLGYYETYEDFAEQMDDWMELNDDEKSWAKEYGKKFFTKDNFDKSSDKKPLHIQSLEKQIARNPEYKKIADSLSKEKDVNDAYFYAFKDAYERNGYEPSENNISDELSDKYWELADGFRDSRGMSDTEWDRFGWEEFERKYGTEADFIDKGLEAHNKYFDELGGSESSDISDKDEQHSESEIVEEDKPNKIRIHPTEGPQVNSGDGWSQISSEEYEELKKGGYEEVDYDDDPDSKQEEDLVKGLDNLEKYIPEDQKEVLQKIRKKLLGNEDA